MSDNVTQAAWSHIIGTAAGTTVISPQPCSFIRVIPNQNQTGTVTFYDVATAAGSTAANLITTMNNNVGSIPTSVEVGCRVRYGLTAVVGGTVDFTVIYN